MDDIWGQSSTIWTLAHKDKSMERRALCCTPKQFLNHVDLLQGISVTPGFKNKTRYTPYVSPGSQISHIATNKGNTK
jgi:hypothetical protein